MRTGTRLDRRREGAASRPTPRSGFVLLEAVVALAILGVASIVLLQVRSQQIRVATQARELLTAQALAEDRVSALRILDYLMLADPPDSLLEGVFPPPFEGFSWTAAVELMDDEHDLFGVEVVVEGPNERFPLRTLLHRGQGLLGADGGGGEGIAGRFQGGRMGMGEGRQGGRRGQGMGGMGRDRGGTGGAVRPPGGGSGPPGAGVRPPGGGTGGGP